MSKSPQLLIMVGLALIVVSLWSKNKTLSEDNDRLKSNNTALMGKAEYYETEAGNSTASVQKLVLTQSELRQNYDDVCKKAKELDIEVKRLESAAKTATETKVKVETQVRDSIVYREGMVDTLKWISWRDPWVDVSGEIRGRDVSLDVVSNDTLIQIVHRVPKKFWFIKYGTKAIRQDMVSSNPHTHITYTEYIELK